MHCRVCAGMRASCLTLSCFALGSRQVLAVDWLLLCVCGVRTSVPSLWCDDCVPSLWCECRFMAACMAETQYLKAIETHTPHLLDEVRGIAAGAEISFDEVFCMSCIDEGALSAVSLPALSLSLSPSLSLSLSLAYGVAAVCHGAVLCALCAVSHAVQSQAPSVVWCTMRCVPRAPCPAPRALCPVLVFHGPSMVRHVHGVREACRRACCTRGRVHTLSHSGVC